MRRCPKCKKTKELSRFYNGGTNTRRCKECTREDSKLRYSKNPEKYRGAVNEWKRRNPEKYKEIYREITRKRKQKLFDMYGRKCTCCGESEEKFLTLEHKNKDGNKDRKKYGTGYMYQLALKRKDPKRYEILCYNCNNAKARYNQCPHKTI